MERPYLFPGESGSRERWLARFFPDREACH
jgi:hypothetical protein